MNSKLPIQNQLDDCFLLACENGDLEQARIALSEGARSNARSTAGETAIHLAVKSGSVKMVTFLTHDLRLDVDEKDAYGRTPLHWAAQQGNVSIAEVLLLNHAKVDATDDTGVEPKIYAEMAGHRDLVKIFSLVRSPK